MRESFKRVRYSVIKRSLSHSTHEVFNQGRPLVDFNLYLSDPALQRSIKAFAKSPGEKIKLLLDYGGYCGQREVIELADAAEKNKPVLKQFDTYGRRIDVVDYHPAYHALMKQGLVAGSASYGYNRNDHVTRSAITYLQNQVEQGHCCPITMTCASIPVFQKANIPELNEWLKKVLTQDYDPSNSPIEQKTAATMGMSMTEKQGGSDVRANTTLATPIDQGKKGMGSAYSLRGHKWFTSAPMSDGFFTLAKLSLSEPPSLFLVPRWLPDGTRNTGFRIMRLKDKCADRANASSEIEYDDAWALLVSEPGKGVKAIMDMVSSTRLDCCLGSSGTARRALQHVLAHTSTRQAFGKLLVDQPLMENLLTDLCIESEAHTLTSLRLAAAYDRAECGDDKESELFRIGVSVSKYYITKRLPNFSYECMEIFGGNGFAEEFPMAKLFRHSPLNSIWEGSGNVIALDVLRGAKSLPYLLEEINLVKGMDTHFDKYIVSLIDIVSKAAKDPLSIDNQRHARFIADQLAMGLQTSLLLRYSTPSYAQGYIASRISPRIFGELSVGFGSSYGSFSFPHELSKNIIQENIPVFY